MNINNEKDNNLHHQDSSFSSNNYNNNSQRTGIVQTFLHNINQRLVSYNRQPQMRMWTSILKWNYNHHLVKNILKLMNKTLKGLNKYHVFKKDYVYVLIAMSLGYVVGEVEAFYIEGIQKNRIMIINKAQQVVIEKVLQNQLIRLKLQQTLNEKIFMDSEIQRKLKDLFTYKLLIPKRQQLNLLVKQSLIKLMRSSDQLQKLAQEQASKAIVQNKDFISKAAFKFLSSQTMHRIITEDVAPLINGEVVQRVVSQQAVQTTVDQMKKQENRKKAYDFIREKIV